MSVITAKYRVVTPLFMAADPAGDAELRAASLKGVLRFWYRATALAAHGSWRDVQKMEAQVFGGVGSGQGQASFLLRLRTGNSVQVIKPSPTFDFRSRKA